MITQTGVSLVTGNSYIYEFQGLSSDTKPTKEDYPNLGNASTFLEIDTQTLFFYDEANEQWV